MARIVVNDTCTNCTKCTRYCPMDILYMDDNKKLRTRNEETCIECLSCELICPYDSIVIYPAYNPQEHLSILPH